MQAQTAVPTPSVDAAGATDAVQLSTIELLLFFVTLLVLAAFVTSLIKWIALLRRGTRLLGSDALVPARQRARPYWNPALFIFFMGVLIVASLLFNGWAIGAGWITKPAASTQNVGDENIGDKSVATEDVVVMDPMVTDTITADLLAEDLLAEDTVAGDTVAGDTVAGDTVAGDTVSENTVAPDAVAEQAGKAGVAGTPASTPAISVPQLLLSSAAMLTATIMTLLFAQLFRPQLPFSDSEMTASVPRERPRIGCLPQRGDITLGFRAAWLILPPTMLLMGLVSVLQKYSHPVLDALKPDGPDSAPDFGVFAALFFTTAIITPVVEEFWFRGLLQGGLQRLADMAVDARRYWDRSAERPAIFAANVPVDSIETSNPQHAEAVLEDPYASPREVEKDPVVPRNNLSSRQIDQDIDTSSNWTPTAVWPIVVTSLVFAVMHWGQGLAPIPLFFLSLGLGYLYRQTGSLVPPIVVHFTLNGFTMCVTLLQFLR